MACLLMWTVYLYKLCLLIFIINTCFQWRPCPNGWRLKFRITCPSPMWVWIRPGTSNVFISESYQASLWNLVPKNAQRCTWDFTPPVKTKNSFRIDLLYSTSATLNLNTTTAFSLNPDIFFNLMCRFPFVKVVYWRKMHTSFL